MASVAEDAQALLAAVNEEELLLPPVQRATGATDCDLQRITAVLRAAARPDRDDSGSGLAGLISKTVTDGWSLTSGLSERLVSFDRRLRPSR